MAACCGGGAARVAGSFLVVLVSGVLDVEGTGGGDCNMSEDPSDTALSSLSAVAVAVAVAVADTVREAEGIHTVGRKRKRVT